MERGGKGKKGREREQRSYSLHPSELQFLVPQLIMGSKKWDRLGPAYWDGDLADPRNMPLHDMG